VRRRGPSEPTSRSRLERMLARAGMSVDELLARKEESRQVVEFFRDAVARVITRHPRYAAFWKRMTLYPSLRELGSPQTKGGRMAALQETILELARERKASAQRTGNSAALELYERLESLSRPQGSGSRQFHALLGSFFEVIDRSSREGESD